MIRFNMNHSHLVILIMVSLAYQSNAYGDPCLITSDCTSDWQWCDSMTDGTFECEHKDMFPMYMLEFVGCLFCLFILLIANSGGIGGGGVVIPISLAFFKFDARESIALSNVSVFFSCLVRFILVLKKKHPLKDFGVEVDYNIATLMLPSIILGANLGVMVNLVLPEIVICLCFTIVLLILFIRTSRRA